MMMQMQMQSMIFTFFVLVLSSTAFSEALFHYKMVDLPVSVLECENQLDDWKIRFEKQTERQVYNLKCVARGSKRSDIHLSYVSEIELELVSTISYLDYAYAIAYRTEQACQSDLKLEIENFRKYTGLEPFVAYCGSPSKNSDPSLISNFAIRIESFGSPKLYPFTYSGMVLPNIGETVTQLQNKINEVKNTEIQISRVRFVRDIGGHSVFLHYYAKERACIKSERIFKFYEKESCERYEEVIQTIFTKHGSAPVLGFMCGGFGGFYESQLLYTHPKINYWTEVDPKEFASHRLCEANRAAVVSFRRDVLKEPILDGFCQLGSQGKFVITLISQRELKDSCF